MTFEPDTTTIRGLLEQCYPLVVPKYQRDYAWSKDQLEDFIGDIRGRAESIVASDNRGSASLSPLFFGGVVTVRVPTPREPQRSKWSIVDGQQRLATFVLGLKVLNDAYKELAAKAKEAGDEATAKAAAKSAEDDYDSYLFKSTRARNSRETVRIARLTLSGRDKDFFLDLLEDEGPTRSRESHDRILAAQRALTRQLVAPLLKQAETPGRRLDSLDAIRDTLLEQCEVIHIESDSEPEAYRLFSVLNDRGMRLADGDLLRARTLELLEGKVREQNRVEGYWDKILDQKPEDVDTFLRDYYASHTGRRSPSKNLFSNFEDQFFILKKGDTVKLHKKVVANVEQMQVELAAHQALRAGSWPYESSSVTAWERDRVNRLVTVLERTTTVPLLMSAYRYLPETSFSQLVQFLERMDFRYLVVGAHAGSLGERYYKHAKDIREEKADFDLEAMMLDIEKFVAGKAGDAIFEAALPGKVKYSSAKQNRRAKHFLTTLDDFYVWHKNGCHGEPKTTKTSTWDLEAIWIDHIYPQKSAASERVEELEPVKHDLGNLTPLSPSENVKFLNKPFREKRDDYPDADMELTKDLAQLQDWNLQELRVRQQRLLEMALSVYYLSDEAKQFAAGAAPASDDSDADYEAAPRVWLVAQKEESEYDDVEGEIYHYPKGIPNAQQMRVGDAIVFFRSKKAERKRQGMLAGVFGVGRIDLIEPDDDGLLKAHLSAYRPVETALDFDAVGGDPRSNRRNSINLVSDDFLQNIIAAASLGEI